MKKVIASMLISSIEVFMDKKKLFLAAILILTFSKTNIFGQELKTENKNESDSTNTQKEIRKVFIYSSLGLPEIISLGVGYQVSQKFAVSVKWSGSFVGGGDFFPNSGTGVGTKISYYFPPHIDPTFIFNYVSFETVLYYYLTLTKQPPPIIKGGFINLNIGKEIITKEGLRVFWGIGLNRSIVIDQIPTFTIAMKVGINYNFF